MQEDRGHAVLWGDVTDEERVLAGMLLALVRRAAGQSITLTRRELEGLSWNAFRIHMDEGAETIRLWLEPK